MDYTGTGNTLNAVHPQVLQLIMDSLRYWVTEMHVDGFRFDLASALAREFHEVDRLGSFFDIIHQDPVLSRVKLIAEPWDVAEGGYQVGNFPALWSEWNDKYRDSVRAFWKGDDGQISELAYRLTGASDLYQGDGRRPYASINFITAHDGFTLQDLVSYNEKHNEANGEDNRDGHDHNLSWNCGVEGPTRRPGDRRRARADEAQSDGHPAPLAGGADARPRRRARPHAGGQQQRLLPGQRDVLGRLGPRRPQAGVPRLHARPDRPARAASQPGPAPLLPGAPIRGSHLEDLAWFRPDGEPMTDEEWEEGWARAIAMRLGGKALTELDAEGNRLLDDDLFLLLNGHYEPVTFSLPPDPAGNAWTVVVDTASGEVHDDGRGRVISAGEAFALPARSLLLLRR